MEAVSKVVQPTNICNAPTEPGEEWRLIEDPRLNPYYWISNYGRIWSTFTNKFLTIQTNDAGYKHLHISAKAGGTVFFLLHRLIAAMFLPEPEEGQTIIDHIDGNPGNNKPENLRWCDAHGNIHNSNTLPNTHRACREVAAMKGHAVKCEGYSEPFLSAAALADELGVTVGLIRECCRSGKPVGERHGINNGKGWHVEYLQNAFDSKQKPVTAEDAVQAAKAALGFGENYTGHPVWCVEDALPFPSASSAARAYGMTVPALITNRQRTDSGVSNQPEKKGFRITHHFASMSREAYLKWVDEHVPKAD